MQKQEGKVEEELDSEKEPKKEKYSALENQEINTEYLENKIDDEEEPKKKKFNVYREKSMDEYEEFENQKKKKMILPICIGIIIIIAIIFSLIFAFININSDKMMSGISINGIEVSGLTKEETVGKLEAIINAKKENEISLKYQDYETQINPELIEVNYNINDIVDEAYNIGRSGNIIENNYNILFTLIGKKNLNINASLNEEVLRKTLTDASSNLPGAIKESSYYIEDDNLIITKGQKGVYIDEDKVIETIKQKLNDINDNSQDFIEIAVKEKEPEVIDIDKIHEEVYKEAKDAYYVKEPFQIFPEINGVDFNVDQAKELLKEDKQEYTIKLTISKPSVTIEQIGSEAFPDRLGHFTTRYDASNVNRTTNLRLACSKINGKVLLPGETFSYNKTLGERTISAGYKEAAIYANGQVVDGLGGGICQISSTLYNSVLYANLEIVERRNHQFVTSYVQAGLDATVVYGLTDFQFKNTRKYPIKISANVQNGIATVDIYGIKEEEEYTISFDVRRVATIPSSTKYIEDATLAVGTEEVIQKGASGVQTETYIIKTLNGKVVSRSLLSKDTYNAMQRIVKRGTKATTTSTPTTTTPSSNQTKPTSSSTTDKTPESSKDKKPSTGATETNAEKTNTGTGTSTTTGTGSASKNNTSTDSSSKNNTTTESNKKDKTKN